MSVTFRRENYKNSFDDPLGFTVTQYKVVAWADWMPLNKEEGFIGLAPVYMLMPGALELFAHAFEQYANNPMDEVPPENLYEWELIKLLRAARKENVEIQWS